MILRTSNSCDDTVDQFWRLRSLLAAVTGPLRKAIDRSRLIASYRRIPPGILDDIGLSAQAVDDAASSKEPASVLQRRYNLEKAWEARCRPPFSSLK